MWTVTIKGTLSGMDFSALRPTQIGFANIVEGKAFQGTGTRRGEARDQAAMKAFNDPEAGGEEPLIGSPRSVTDSPAKPLQGAERTEIPRASEAERAPGASVLVRIAITANRDSRSEAKSIVTHRVRSISLSPCH